MFKNRYFVVGLGCGIIVGVLLLQMIMTGQNMMHTLTKEQLEREAERQGYQLVPVNAEKPSALEIDSDALVSQHDSEDGPELSANVEKPVASPSHSNKVNASEQEQATVEEAEVQTAASAGTAEEPGETVSKNIYIKPNTTSTAIAEQLMEAGVIADDVAFAEYIKTQQMQSKLRAGSFKFQVPSTHEQALKVLTSHPNG